MAGTPFLEELREMMPDAQFIPRSMLPEAKFIRRTGKHRD
jgi:hypothetical protein